MGWQGWKLQRAGFFEEGACGFFQEEIEFEDFSVESDIQDYFSTLSTREIEALKAEIQGLKTLVNNNQQKPQEKNMSHVIAIGTLTATVLGLTAAFPPAAVAFGFLVLGAGLVARD
jgi:fructosamine-3-kinase